VRKIKGMANFQAETKGRITGRNERQGVGLKSSFREEVKGRKHE
jgi:hypothetical protein